MANKENYSVKIDLEFTKEEYDLIRNFNFEKGVYVSTKNFNFDDKSYNDVCVPLMTKHIIESTEGGYPLQPDFCIKLSEIGERVLEKIVAGKVKIR